MELHQMPRQKVIEKIDGLVGRLNRRGKPSADDQYLMTSIVRGVEALFMREIRERQARIPGLDTGEFGYTAVWGGELTEGCKNCVKHNFLAIRAASTCNLKCDFCFYFGQQDEIERLMPDRYGVEGNTIQARDIKLMIRKAVDGPKPVTGVAWVWQEPFTEFAKHPALMTWIHDEGVYQHIYTNGTLCTPDNLKALADTGLEEIRFNLAATNCSDKVIKNMGIARDLFPTVCVESPMVPKYFERFVQKREQIMATGVTHIHCAELHLNQQNLDNYKDEELYQFGRFYISPMSSRRLTYDLMDLAVEEGWEDLVIHDCSNEVKMLRGVSDMIPGHINYTAELEGIELPWFRNAARTYDFTTLAEA
jgi:uncharacterized protein